MRRLLLCQIAILLVFAGFPWATRNALLAAVEETDATLNQVYAPKLLEGLKYRSLGFSRGGRSTTVTGVASQPLTYYMGSTGGGVWKTTDAGITWKNVSDEAFKVGTLGALAVAPSDPNVVYAGTGSACPRGNVSVGNGIYRSTDAGKTWTHIGLPKAGQIGRIEVHPTNPDMVYAAVLGAIFGPNEERGVYRSKDGGQSWEKSLYVSPRTGAVDISMDPNNPRVLYAAMWTAQRKPWTLISGSEEGGLYKTVDGGDNWKKLEKGLPKGLVGKIGVSVSAADSDRVWAIIEAKEGGVYRSDDAGASWKRVNQQANLRQRPWYYTHIYADTKDRNVVYVLNTGMYKSTDGGVTYDRIRTPHGDNHDLWISPIDNRRMIEANDGGANVSLNGGASWSVQTNQPTAEIYRVVVDGQFPYRVYGAQQDNSTISVPSRPSFGVVEDWYAVGGCESGHIAVDPRDPDIVYAGCYGGDISRINRKTGESRDILIYPQLQLGQAPKDLRYRFQWNAPIRISPHDPKVLYHTSQFVHRSTDEGRSWETISPDLTRDEKSRQGYSGEPISHDSTGVEVYDVIFAFEESPAQKGLLWAGSDDGLVHVSKDNGKHWDNVTPKEMPEWGTVNMIELSAHDPGRAFIAVHRYRENDFAPYIFRTNDYGKTWELLTDGSNGIPADHFVRVVREDPDRSGLLYAGTEFGIYVSFDDGGHWQSLQLNLPVTPVTDLAVHDKDLVVATQGRAFWILDNLTPLHQLGKEVADSKMFFYTPAVAYRTQGGQADIDYYLDEAPETEASLEIVDSAGAVVRTFKGKSESKSESDEDEEDDFRGPGETPLPLKAGHNRFQWNLRQSSVEKPKGVVVWGGARGAKVRPGVYQVKLKVGDWSQTRPLEIKLDPRLHATDEDLAQQAELGSKVRELLERVFGGVKSIREVRGQTSDFIKDMKDSKRDDAEVREAGEKLVDRLKEIEEKLTQPKSKSSQDPLNFPPMLDNQLVTLYDYVTQGDDRPNAGAYERFQDLKKEADPLLKSLDEILSKDVPAFNEMIRKKDLGPVLLSK